MNSRRSLEERPLNPEQYALDQYEHEAKNEADESLTLGAALHRKNGVLRSIAMRKWPQKRHACHFAQMLKTLLPSFALASGRKQHAVVQAQLKPTSYMDGLRGVACWCVFVGHVWRPWKNYPVEADKWDFPWGSDGEHCLIFFPIIRAVYSGTFMVQIFFVLSGYVLSLKPLSLIRSQSSETLFNYLSAAAFRRVFRLFLPVIAAQLILSFIIFSGNYGTNFIGIEFEPGKDSIWLQLGDFWSTIMTELDPFRWDREQPPYMAQLWTISVEFRGSIIVYLIILALANVKSVVRLTILALFVVYCHTLKMWDIADFVCGMILAEASLIRKDSELDLTNFFLQFALPDTIQTTRAVFWTVCKLVALWMGTYPLREGNTGWSYVWFTKFIPSVYQESDWLRSHFSIFCGSVLLLIALENFKPLQRPYTTVVAQYLGKISFSLYIVHQPLGHSLNREIPRYIFTYIPIPWVAYIISMAIVTFTTVWASDVFWRLVDVNSIQAARIIRKWCEI